MASRVVEVLYKLKDLFTPTAKKIEKSYESLGKSAEEAAASVDQTNTAVGGTVGKLQARFNTLKTLAKGGIIGKAIFEFGQAVKDSSDYVLELARSARRLGVTTQEFLDFKDIAGKTEATVGELERAFGRINTKLQLFRTGSKAAAKQFQALGIDAKEFAKLDAAAQLERLAEAANQLGGGEDALAAVGKLIGAKPGDGLLLLIEQGPAAVRDVAEAAKETGEVWDKDVAEAAKRVELLSEGIAASWRGITSSIRNALVLTAGGALKSFGVGIGDEQIALRNVNAALENRDTLLKSIQETQEAGLEVSQAQLRNLRLVNADLERTTAIYGEYQDAEKANTKAKQDGAKATAELKQANDDFKVAQKELVKGFDEQTKKVSANLQVQKREFADARRDQIAVERAFRDLINDVTGTDIQPEDVSIADVFGKLNQALSASERGNLDEAVSLAIDGADYLGLLKEKGTESQSVLGYLAQQLSDVANASAAARTAAEQEDVTGAESVVKQLEAQKASIEKQGEISGAAYGKSFVAGAEAELAKLSVPAPVADASAQGQGYIEWAGDSNSRRHVDGKMVK